MSAQEILKLSNSMSTFVGYWGSGNKAELNYLLAKILPEQTHNSHNIEHTFANSNNCFRVTGWGKHVQTNFQNEKLSVSLAASALPDDADVCVEISGDGLKMFRDDFGRATLFWTPTHDAIWFATQLKFLLPLLDEAEISLPALYGYSCFSYVPAPLTPVKNIFAMQAGATEDFQMVETSEPHQIKSSLSPSADRWREFFPKEKNENSTAKHLQQLLKSAITKQLSDHSEPVGVFLSGGLDSAIVAALLVQAGANVKAFTLDFGEYGNSEMPFAESVAQHLKIPLIKVDASPQRIKAALLATAKALDLPYGDGVTVPLYLLGQAAANECDVVFNGEGGDQLFAGWTNKPLIAADVYQSVHPDAPDFYQEYLRTFHRLQGYESQVFLADSCAEIQKLNLLNWLDEALDDQHTPSMLHRLRRANLLLKGAGNIQPRATNLALVHGLAVRTPFCDEALTEYSFQLPNSMFLQGVHEKYILKKAVENWLPDEIVWREKRGMGVPLTQWCLAPLWYEIGHWLQPSVFRDEGFWQEDLALRISTGQFSGQIQGRRIGEILWLLMMWQTWRFSILQKDVKRNKYSPFMLPSKFWQVAYPRLSDWMKMRA